MYVLVRAHVNMQSIFESIKLEIYEVLKQYANDGIIIKC